MKSFRTISSTNSSPSFKHALIIPILKKVNLDKKDLNDYRPISNLSIFSKTLERIISK